MKAIVYEEYGTPDLLQLNEVEKPSPKDNEVLIKVHATSLNSSDYELLSGSPAYVRIWGLRKPKNKILGSDIAGRVEAVGNKVKEFQPGDDVFGDVFESWGGLAEYTCVPEKKIMLKPENITFEEAAALPQAAGVALQGLRFKGKIQAGQKVLINGAGGGSGSFAVQIAKMMGTEVTGVDSTPKLESMRSIGADHVIDYTREDFTKKGQQYDLILDLVASHTVLDYKRALAPKGVYAMAGGDIPHLFRTLLIGSWISMTGSRKIGVLGAKANKDLAYTAELVESGKIKAVIEKTYKLSDAPEAFRHLGGGHAQGKLVITL